MTKRARVLLAALAVALLIPLANAQVAYDAELGVEASTRYGVQPYGIVRFMAPLTSEGFARVWFIPEVGAWTNWSGIPQRAFARVGVLVDTPILSAGGDFTQRIGQGWTESSVRAFVRASW